VLIKSLILLMLNFFTRSFYFSLLYFFCGTANSMDRSAQDLLVGVWSANCQDYSQAVQYKKIGPELKRFYSGKDRDPEVWTISVIDTSNSTWWTITQDNGTKAIRDVLEFHDNSYRVFDRVNSDSVVIIKDGVFTQSGNATPLIQKCEPGSPVYELIMSLEKGPESAQPASSLDIDVKKVNTVQASSVESERSFSYLKHIFWATFFFTIILFLASRYVRAFNCITAHWKRIEDRIPSGYLNGICAGVLLISLWGIHSQRFSIEALNYWVTPSELGQLNDLTSQAEPIDFIAYEYNESRTESVFYNGKNEDIAAQDSNKPAMSIEQYVGFKKLGFGDTQKRNEERDRIYKSSFALSQKVLRVVQNLGAGAINLNQACDQISPNYREISSYQKFVNLNSGSYKADMNILIGSITDANDKICGPVYRAQSEQRRKEEKMKEECFKYVAAKKVCGLAGNFEQCMSATFNYTNPIENMMYALSCR